MSTPNIYQDNVLILHERNAWIRERVPDSQPPVYRRVPAQATKTHQRLPDGSWVTDGYHIDSDASALAFTTSCLQMFMAVLVEAGRDPLNYLVGDVVIPGRNPRRINRRVRVKESRDGHKIPPDLTAHPVGHHWICWEVDKIGDVPPHLDPRLHADRDAAFVDWWIRAHLPPAFHGRDAVLQWSASAFVNGKLSMHIWQWLDRPVARACLHAFFQRAKHDPHHWCHAIDINVFGGARVHYIAPPTFRDLDGSALPDFLADRRWLYVKGGEGDTCEALPEWVDLPTWNAQLAAQAAQRDAARARRVARAAPLSKASAAVVLAASSLGHVLDLGSARRCVDEDKALKTLSQIVHKLEQLPPHAGRHNAVLAATAHAAKACGHILSRDQILAALETPCVNALLGGTPRSAATASDEFRRALDGALSKVRCDDLGPAPTPHDDAPAFAAIGAAAILAAAPCPVPLDLSGDTPQVVVPRTVTELMEDWGIQLTDARAQLTDTVRRAVASDGRFAIKAPTGLGKSYAICNALIDHRREHRLSPTSPAILAAPSLDLARELCDSLRAKGANAVVAVTRTARNCERFAELTAAQRLTPDGGKRVCESCPWHPRNAGSADACIFWREATAQKNADIICKSHALLALQGATAARFDGDSATVRVCIDWKSFDGFAPGCPAWPRVRRTDSGVVVRAQISDAPQATPPPTPRWSDTPRWTAASKTALFAWIAQAWGCEPNRRAVMDFAAPHADVVFFDWSEIAKHAGRGGRFKPHRYRQDKGWLQGWHITVTACPDGQPLPALTFSDTRALLPDSKAELRAWIRACWDASTDLALDNYARAHIDEHPVDTLIIDECILHALKQQGSLTRSDLQELKLAGEVSGPGVEALIQMMYLSEQEATEGKRLGKKGSGRRLSHDLRKLAPLSVTRSHETAARRLDTALHLDDDGQRLEALRQGWAWEAVEALHFASTHDWAGAYIAKGVLYVASPRPLDVNGVRSVILLDATATPKHALACFGSTVQWHEVGLGRNPFTEVIHIPTDLGPEADAWGDASGPKSKRNAAHFLATLARWHSPETVTFVHKKVKSEERSWLAPLLNDPSLGAVTYHGSPLSRGSNLFRDFTTCIMTSHYVSAAAKRQQAELLAHMCGASYDDAPDAWDAEGGWISEGAAVVQALSRIRPLDATATAPKRVIMLDARPPEAFGLFTTQVLDPDLLAWQTLRFLPALSDNDGEPRIPVMQAVAHDLLDAVGGALPLGGLGVGWGATPLSLKMPEIAGWTPFGSLLQEKGQGATPQSLSKRLNTWMRKRFRSSEAFAEALGCQVVEVAAWTRQPVAFLVRAGETLTHAQVEPFLSQRGVRDYRLPGEGVWRTVGALESELLPLSRALVALPRQRIEEGTIGGLVAYGAMCCGVSEKTIRRWLAKAAHGEEDNRAVLVRLWHSAHAQVMAEVAAENLARMDEAQAAAYCASADAYVAAQLAEAWALPALAEALGWDQDKEDDDEALREVRVFVPS